MADVMPAAGAGRWKRALGWAEQLVLGVCAGAFLIVTPPSGWPFALLAAGGLLFVAGRQRRLARRHRAALAEARLSISQFKEYAVGWERHAREAIVRSNARAQEAEHEAAALRRQRAWAVEATRHAVAYLVRQRIPAALRGEPAPAPPDEHLDSKVAELLDEVAAAVADAAGQHRDRLDAMRAAVLALAQRSQALAHRSQDEATKLVNRFPRNQEVLDASNRVDHALAMVARDAQKLRVLCGDAAGQQWPRPYALVDVVRAAAGRILYYTRVEVQGDQEIGVAARAVEPLIHLVAELLANATQSSPPTTKVKAQVISVEQGAVIEIDDCGVGMTQYRLIRADEIASGRRPMRLQDLGAEAQTGLPVVGEYARRHGIKVKLGQSVYGGIQAVIRVPAELVELVELAPPADPPATEPQPPAEPRPSAPTESRPGTELPRRRSRRHEGTPDPAPAPEPPSRGHATTPERERDWMNSLFGAGAPHQPQGPSEPSGDERPTNEQE